MFRLLALAFVLTGCAATQPTTTAPVTLRADLAPTRDASARGSLTLSAVPGGTQIVGQLTGVAPGVHGLHIHETGDCSAPDASSAGGHFNPLDVPHGPPSAIETQRHVGDLGNVVAAADGTVEVQITDPLVSLDAVLGRAVILHSGPDDYASQPSGDAGDRVACGVLRSTAP